jgi:CDP-6-deoxy-D-xylo-4-hexulose-3-dehydrase
MIDSKKKTVDEAIQDLFDTLRENGESLFKYVYNKTTFIPGKDTVYYSGPFWDDHEPAAAIKALLTGRWLATGENVHYFEREFSKKFGFDDSLMTNSGSSANLVMIAALKKRFRWADGDEVIVSCVGFPTTISAIVQNKLTPVFVDITMKDLNWDISQIEKLITNRTVAMFSSPVLGNPYNLDEVVKLCQRYSIKLVSDNCDSLGSKWDGRLLTEYSVAASTSFYPSHHITTGEGGMVSSNDPEIIRLARSFAWWGRGCDCVGSGNLLPNGTCGKRFSKWLEEVDEIVDHKYIFENIGYNLKPLDLQGAIGLVQLQKFDQIHKLRRENKEKISKILSKNITGITIPEEHPKAEAGWFGVPIICETPKLKRALVAHLESNKIQTRNYFSGNILVHPGYRPLGDYQDYPEANKVLSNVFFIGCAPTYLPETFDYIESVVKSFKPSLPIIL